MNLRRRHRYAHADIDCGLCEYVIVFFFLPVSHDFGWHGSPVILWISPGGKPKWLPLKLGYHDVMRTSPIDTCSLFWMAANFFFFNWSSKPQSHFIAVCKWSENTCCCRPGVSGGFAMCLLHQVDAVFTHAPFVTNYVDLCVDTFWLHKTIIGHLCNSVMHTCGIIRRPFPTSPGYQSIKLDVQCQWVGRRRLDGDIKTSLAEVRRRKSDPVEINDK